MHKKKSNVNWKRLVYKLKIRVTVKFSRTYEKVREKFVKKKKGENQYKNLTFILIEVVQYLEDMLRT